MKLGNGEDARGRVDDGLTAVMSERSQLLNLAYRLLGSVADAEDVVQEAYARWYAMTTEEQETIGSAGGWLMRVASRICLDVLRSARARRERYVGEWIPEPVPGRTEWVSGRPDPGSSDPADRVTLDESINMAFLVVLDSMTPAERVTFVLHDVFRYSFPEVAAIVGRTPAACRQLATSARRRISSAGVVPPPRPAERVEVVSRFRRAWEAKDVRALVDLLDPDATAVADGGGLVDAQLRPIRGAGEIAQYLMHLAELERALTLVETTVNGQPGLVIQQGGATTAVVAFHIGAGRIKSIWAVRNPQKLRSWTTS